MKATTQKTIKYSIPVILIAFVAIFYFYKHPTAKQANTQKCPEDYAENDTGTEEYRNALIEWTKLFFEANPKATMSDWSLAKLKLWQNNNCTIALERSTMSGEVSDLKPWERVDWAVQESLDIR